MKKKRKFGANSISFLFFFRQCIFDNISNVKSFHLSFVFPINRAIHKGEGRTYYRRVYSLQSLNGFGSVSGFTEKTFQPPTSVIVD